MNNIKYILAPQLDANDDNLKIVEIKVNKNSKININEHIVSVESSKIVEEIYSEYSGYINFLVKINEEIKSGQKIAAVSESLDDLNSLKLNEISQFNNEGKKDNVTKKAKELIDKYNLDIKNFVNKKIINEKLILEYLNANDLSDIKKNKEYNLGNFQSKISENVLSSQKINATAYMNVEFNHNAIEKLVLKYQEQMKISLNFFDLLLFIIPKAVDKYPLFKSYLNKNTVIENNNIDINFTVEFNNKLFLPIIEDIPKLQIKDIIKKKLEIVRSIYKNKINSQMLKVGCISLASIDSSNVLYHYPIIFNKQSAIIGINNFQFKGSLTENLINNSVGLTLSYDHRLINGNYASSFLDYIIELAGKL